MNWSLSNRKRDNELSLDFFRRDIYHVFDNFFSLTTNSLFDSEWIPIIDVMEDDKALHIKAEIPGIEEKDLNVTIENNVLTLTGEKREEKNEKSNKYLFSERKFGSFSRSITLPEGIKTDKVKAAFKKGVLKIDILKNKAKEPEKIAIEVH